MATNKEQAEYLTYRWLADKLIVSNSYIGWQPNIWNLQG